MFWAVAAGLLVLVSVPMVRALVRRDRSVTKSAELDMGVYKDQLAEVERDLARGVLGTAEAEAARTEVARRLLAADKRAQGETGSGGRGPAAVGLLVLLLSLSGAVWLYTTIGQPGLPDLPLQARMDAAKDARDARPDQIAAEATAPPLNVEVDPNHADLVAQLRTAVEQNPNDPNGLRLLADNEARLGNLVDARKAQERLMVVLADDARPDDFVNLGEIMILAAGGYVSPQAEQALVKALNADPRNPRARYYSGLSLAQTGRPDVAYRMWAGLLEEGPSDAPWIPLIQSQIGRVARAAGIPLTDSTATGPTAEDVENATQMTDTDRQDMIRGMVAGLAERLATDGGTPAEWARLIRAYGVLGETAQANAIWLEAEQTFAQNAAAMSVLREAARAAEVLQ